MIPYEDLRKLNAPFEAELIESAQRTIESGWFVLGKSVSNFEEEFAHYNGSKHCIGVASGLDALILSLAAFEFERGSEVLVPANTYIATILAIIHNGLRPVLVEPDYLTCNIDANLLVENINAKTKAILVVHLYGKPCDMRPIMETANKYGLKLIEDCAQSHGAEYFGKKTGNFGHCNAFSFYPTKNLGALGDGGAVMTDDAAIAEKVRKLRNYGSSVKYHNDLVGYNSRLDEIQAGFLSVKLKYLNAITAHKRLLADIYQNELSDAVLKPVNQQDFSDVYHIYAIRSARRDALKAYLQQYEIGTEIHYPIAPHRQHAIITLRAKGLIQYADDDFPISQKIHEQELSLPISYFHTPEQIRHVAMVINAFTN